MTSRANCAKVIATVTIAVLALVAVVSVEARLTYPYALGTPGTFGNAAVGLAIPVNRRLEDRGTDSQGRAFHCDELVSEIGRVIDGKAGSKARAHLSGAGVIGVAVVEHSPGETYAYFAKSGAESAPLTKAERETDAIAKIVELIASWNIGHAKYTTGAPLLSQANRWHLIDSASSGNDAINAVRVPNIVVDLPNAGTGIEATDATIWSQTPLNVAAPETIQFAMATDKGQLQRVYKRWYYNHLWDKDASPNTKGQCALQKLVGTLRGFGEELPVSALNALRPFVGSGTSTFICAAEAAYNAPLSSLKSWDGRNPTYQRFEEVPSCTACQAIVPSMLDGSIATQNCIGVIPANGRIGDCGNVANGADCSVTCDGTFVPFPARAKCHRGTFTKVQQCKAACPIRVDWENTISTTCPGRGGVLRHGQSCQHVCRAGYVAIADTTCSNGVLAEYRCVEKGCAMQDRPANGRTLGNCDNVAHGASCSVSCRDNYEPWPPTVQCNKGILPAQECTQTCHGVVPANGKIGNCGSVANGADCSVICNANYVPIPARAQCDRGGFQVPQVCKAPCPINSPWANTKSTKCPGQGGYLLHDATCTHVCRDGYELSSPQTTCTDGQLAPARCVEKACSLNVVPANSPGIGTCGNVKHGSSCSILCE